ncbi:MAG: hypothetical protein FWH51_06640 [Dehalococcoidia bacterium]|nr:hypothetical protein [Dehalococcoidia bacterium]
MNEESLVIEQPSKPVWYKKPIFKIIAAAVVIVAIVVVYLYNLSFARFSTRNYSRRQKHFQL